MPKIIRLTDVIYDKRARDGTWCCLPYPNHPRGCPKFPDCPKQVFDFKDYSDDMVWFAVIEEFDLKEHAIKMKKKHPKWSDRQCRCVLYWQSKVRKKLMDRCKEIGGEIIRDPEAAGVNLFATMSKYGLFLKANPDYVYKIAFVGKLGIDDLW